MKIYLIGMPLSGKSTIGKLLAQKLNLNFVDLDELIVNTNNESIEDMFLKGESYFRLKETESLSSLYNIDNIVVACGGGIIVKEENLRLLNGLVIYLDVSVKTLNDRNKDITNNRPLLKNNSLEELYDSRKEKYLYFADLTIENNDIDKTLEEIVGYYNENISN